MRRSSIVGVVVAVLAPMAAAAIDAPHDQTFSDGNCSNCHTMFDKGPSGDPDYNRACLTCHNAITNGRLGTWLSADQAEPGKGGSHHSWSGYAANPNAGARSPVNAAMASQLVDGRLQCTVCHNPHKAAPENAPGKQDVSTPVGTGGAGGLVVVAPGGTPKAYRLKIQTVGAGGGTFVVSHDFGLASPSWFNWDGSGWVIGTAAGTGKPYSDGADVTLADPAVKVRFAAGASPGHYWDFYVSWPFMRAPIQDDAMCLQCHAERAMTSNRVRGSDPAYRVNGVRRFSHPVGEALNSNGLGHDRSAAELLDASGVLQTSGDGNPTNDLVLSGGVVRCTTCHGAHGADTNSLTSDLR